MLSRRQVAGAGVQGLTDIDRLMRVGFGSYLVLSGDADFYIPTLRQLDPNARIVLRFYDAGLFNRNPRDWARWCRDFYRKFAHLNVEVMPANEMNLPVEGGGDSEGHYDHINWWLLEWLSEWQQEFPGVVTHWPALAPYHGEDTKGYPRCTASLAAYDVIDVHGYWSYGGLDAQPTDGSNSAFLWIGHAQRFFPNKPIYLSEWNRQWTHGNPEDGERYASEAIDFLTRLQDVPNLIGTATFLYCASDVGWNVYTWLGEPVEERVKAWIGIDPNPNSDQVPVNPKAKAALMAAGVVLLWLLS